jgi:type II secretory ATPase GspE/PulE/Tfp pilus assembly ATPase PilB-like protein
VQIQVREQIGLTFAAGLRSVLRHDPDVVLVGEIRDLETAEIAVRAAQTGHLVFSTLHTNDSISAVTRLLEMHIEPYLIASSLVCSISQRLARRICRHCAQEDTEIPVAIREEMSSDLRISPEDVRAWKGLGCVECNQKGHRGRVAVYDFFLLNEAIADLIRPGLRTGELRRAAHKLGWRSLREMGWFKVQSGLIPISEQERWTRTMGPEALTPAPI